MNYRSYFITVLTLLVSSPLMASATSAKVQSLDTLKSIAENYVYSKINLTTNKRIDVKSSELDQRLRLTHCESEIVAFTPPGSTLRGNTTVGVRCESTNPWSIYIPVKVAIYQKAIISTGKMTRGHIITDADISLVEIDISRIKGHAFIDKNELIGSKIKTSIKLNQVIDSATICLICKGDAVTITVNSSAVSVSMTGKALNDGSKGDMIRVQNSKSRRIIDAVITNSGSVKASI